MYSKKSLADANCFLLISIFDNERTYPKNLASIIETIVVCYML